MAILGNLGKYVDKNSFLRCEMINYEREKMYKQIRKKKAEKKKEGREKKKQCPYLVKKIIEINHLIREEKNKSKGKEKEERKGKKREKKSYPPFFLIYIKKRE